MANLIRSLVLFAAMSGLSAAHADAPVADAMEWRFRVLLDDQEVGFHEFRVNETANERQVDIDAQFDVRFLFFNAFSYRHTNTERWVGGCLREIRSDTRAGRKEFRVRGMADPGGFTVETLADTFALDSPCVQSFAYWDPGILEASRLVNAQTGEWLEVDVEPDGWEAFEFQGSQIDARKYVLQLDEGSISIWYDQGGRWLSLEAPAPGGRVLRYLPERLPKGAGHAYDFATR